MADVKYLNEVDFRDLPDSPNDKGPWKEYHYLGKSKKGIETSKWFFCYYRYDGRIRRIKIQRK